MEVDKFIGCILRLKTRSGEDGASKNIIGTVSDIQIDDQGQRIFLNSGMANGILLPDGFIVNSSEILDLSVISKAVEAIKTKMVTPPLLVPEKDLKKPKPLKNEKNILQEIFGCPPVVPVPPVVHHPPTFLPPQVPHTPSSSNKNGFKGFKNNVDTFEMTNAEIKAQEFDFEGSNSLFEKLPVSKKIEKKPLPVKNFTTRDTTYLQERSVTSIRIQGKAERTFLSKIENFAAKVESVLNDFLSMILADTGIQVPAVPLATRSSILNDAHARGLSHSRTVEVMARAVVEVTLPLLGDSCRLSPEREEDRPHVLISCGPHWQGAVGLAAARLLSTLNCRTTVYCPKQEIHLCAVEESLYELGGGTIHRQWPGDGHKKYDAVIHSLDDHLTKLSVKKYGCRNVILVDPPLADYKFGFEPGTRVQLVTPTLPLAYKDVKVFLVNLAIPAGLFQMNSINYQSPFGARLTVQLF